MSDIQHYIGGKRVDGASGRWGDVYNPATGEKIRRVAFATAGEVDQAVQAAAAAFPGWAATPPLTPRAHPLQVSRTARAASGDAIAADHFRRARQGLFRRPGRDHPRHRGRRVRLRHPASAEGRIHRAGRARHRQLVGAPAIGRVRRHHAVQFSGDGADVDVPDGARLRQHLRPEAVGARSLGRTSASPNC